MFILINDAKNKYSFFSYIVFYLGELFLKFQNVDIFFHF
jgi:hypothetical protein